MAYSPICLKLRFFSAVGAFCSCFLYGHVTSFSLFRALAFAPDSELIVPPVTIFYIARKVRIPPRGRGLFFFAWRRPPLGIFVFFFVFLPGVAFSHVVSSRLVRVGPWWTPPPVALPGGFPRCLLLGGFSQGLSVGGFSRSLSSAALSGDLPRRLSPAAFPGGFPGRFSRRIPPTPSGFLMALL